ncbi:C40 family peptidase [Sporomusa sp.]|uniref:C40 family peptidase n=1 Tax=Sporomusa sp. TaxID=2078658 RepID=UPI002C98CE2B|nr:C40 family peptidase [Sporomusa sp.]HWR05797.1 C40 family peptidase [Sporomusa sp.]
MSTSALSSVAAQVEASPDSGYIQFVSSLDSILTEVMTAGDIEEEITANKPSITEEQTAKILAFAKNMLGQSLVWGGASPTQGFDCSGLVQYVYSQVGIHLPRTADLQFLVGRTVPLTELQPGDLVYFTTYEAGASHVGIYIGGDEFIHTSSSKGVVAIGNMHESYFVERFYGAKRVQ